MSDLHRARRSAQEELIELRKQVNDLREAAVARRRVEEALRSVGEQHRWLLDHAPVGLCWLDPDGALLVANQPLAESLGYRSVGELIELGRTFGVFRSRPSDPDPGEVRFVPRPGPGYCGIRHASGQVTRVRVLARHAADQWNRGTIVAVLDALRPPKSEPA